MHTLATFGRMAIILAALAANAVHAQDTSFDTWWARLTADGGNGPDTDGLMIHYQVTIDGRPNEFKLWRLGDKWRWSRMSNDDSWVDNVVGEHAWVMSSRELRVDNNDAGRDSEVLGMHGPHSSSLFDRRMLMTGGVGELVRRGLNTKPVLRGMKWTFEASGTLPDGLRVSGRASGTWSEEDGWGRVDSLRVEEEKGFWMQVKATGWRRLADGIGIADRAVVSGPNLDRRYSVVGTEPFTKQNFDALVRVPEASGADPVRGPVTFQQFRDYRGTTEMISRVTEDRSTSEPFRDPGHIRSSQFRTVGWVTLASVLTAIVLFRIRKVTMR